MFGVKDLIKSDIVIPSNDDFCLKISLFQPLYSFTKLL